MTKEEQIVALKAKGDAIMKEYACEYEALSMRSENLHEETEQLDKEYKELNAKSGLTAVYEQIAGLRQGDEA